MPVTNAKTWSELDPATRDELDARFLEELKNWSERGLTEEGVRAYLEYRHERPYAAITTFEEGQIHRLLHGKTDPSRLPDPVEQEEHLDAVERFGAQRLHLTNAKTYVAVMLGGTILLLLALLVYLL